MNDYTTPEVWRPVVGYEQYYSVSNLGRVRNEVSRNKHYAGLIRTGDANHDGYLRLSLSADGGRRKVFVHRIVADAFLGQCPDGYEVNHKNGIKTDNAVSNLEYVSHKSNMHHALNTGLWNPAVAIGTKNFNAKLNPDAVRAIRNEYAHNIPLRVIAEKYGVTRTTIALVLQGRIWKHVK